MKDRKLVHVVQILIHLYISILESIQRKFNSIFFIVKNLTSISRNFCLRSSDISDVDIVS